MASISDKPGRISKWLPNESDEEFLTRLNEALSGFPLPVGQSARPLILVGGAPRSGSTIIAQSLCTYLDVDYIDDFAAKFWSAPAVGLRLSKMLGRCKSVKGVSQYGQTESGDIHGFHYFWMNALKIDRVQDLFAAASRRRVDWGTLNREILAMQEVAGKPLLMKGYYPMYFLPEVGQHIKNVAFVYITRNVESEALSILAARHDIMGSIEKWWSMQPPTYFDLLDLPPAEQVVRQVRDINSHVLTKAEENPEVPFVRVKYEDLIESPGETLDYIHKQLESSLGMDIPAKGEIPEIQAREHQYPSEWRNAVSAAIKETG